MKHEWRRFEVSSLIDEGVLVVGDGYRAKNKELGTSGLPFARAGNIKYGFHFETADRFPEEELARVGNKVSQAGDVVFTSKGTVGRFAFVKPDTPRFVYSPQLCFWRSLDPGKVDPRFLYYWMSGPEFSGQVRAVAGQTDMAEYVSLSDQRRMYITLPLLGEQRAIGEVLAALDDRIELNRTISQTLARITGVLFQAWFVDFPDRCGASLARKYPSAQELANILGRDRVSTELGDIPAGWSVLSLDEVARFVNGLALQKYPPSGEQSLPVIKIAQLRSGQVDGADRASAALDDDHVADDGDVLFSWSGSLECKVWTGGRGAVNQHLFKVTSDRYPPWLCYFAVHHHLEEFRRIAAGKATTMGHIQRHHLTGARVAVPPYEDVIVFDRLMGPMFESMWRRDKHAHTLRATRDALLPKLMLGELAVPDAKRLVEAAV